MLPSFARKFAFSRGLLLAFLAFPAALFAQTNYYGANGTEYAIIGQLPGDQVRPDAALNVSGGFVVWQDNATDGSGLGISARKLDGTLSGALSTFRVNVTGTNDQENARVALLKNGGAVFAWQGGAAGRQSVYARFLTPTNTWLTTNDLLVSSGSAAAVFYSTNTVTTITTNAGPHGTHIYTTNTTTTVTATTNAIAGLQVNPAVAVLNNGNVAVIWQSFDEVKSNSLFDVYGQILTTNGTKVGGEFLVNQFTTYNQRSPAVTALPNGGFVVVWVSEQERSSAPNWGTNSTYYSSSGVPLPSVDIYARLYNSNGVAQSGEFLVNADSNPASSPAVAAASDGNYMVTWCAKDMSNATNSWDIYARPFTNAAGGAVTRVNSRLYGDEYNPRISGIGGDFLIVWTSLGQDGSREGVFGKFAHKDGSLVGNEFQINTTWLGQQMQPTVASDGVSQFLTVWTGFTFASSGADLFAQRYLNVGALLPPINTLYVWAPFTLSNGVYQPQLKVSWPVLLGISISNYEVYVDGAATPSGIVTSNSWMMTAADGLTKSSTHSFTVDYVTTDGRRSPPSPSVSGTTWGGLNWGGIPYEWMQAYFGDDINQWPSPNSPVASGAPTLLQIFQTGGIPNDSSTWLIEKLVQTSQGMFLTWNTRPGHVYQVQMKVNLTSAWNNFGLPRFAAGTSDSIFVGGQPSGFYQILFLY